MSYQILFVFKMALGLSVLGTLPNTPLDADAAFKSLENPPAHEKYQNNQDYIEAWEGYVHQYRDRGIELWAQFPKSPTRFKWLETTVKSPPHYWVNVKEGANARTENYFSSIPTNQTLLLQWERQLRRFKNEFFSSNVVSEARKNQLITDDIWSRIDLSFNPAYRNYQAFNLKKIEELFSFYNQRYLSNKIPKEDFNYNDLLYKINHIQNNLHKLGLNLTALDNLLQSIRTPR